MKGGPKPLDQVLASVPLFSNLSPKELSAIAKAGKQQSYEAGRTIVQERHTGVGFYFILEGQVEVRKRGKVIAKLGDGDFFGEMSLIDDQPRSADVVAVGLTKCFSLSAWSFVALVKSEPKVALGMMKELVHRLRSTDSGLAD